ncbi:hypothetical protein J2X73_001819 [Novosphingobium sp. 1748]|nr:hypothetical protein [Novosphingobium sp. 1748]
MLNDRAGAAGLDMIEDDMTAADFVGKDMAGFMA